MAKNKSQSGSNYQAENCHDSMGGQNKSTNRSTNKGSNKATDKMTDKMSNSYESKQ